MRKLTLIAAASVMALGTAGVGAGLAMAQPGGKGHGGLMGASLERADANGDGEISLAEAKAQSAERFAKMDVNADGAISKADREARQQERFAEADANGDGEITPAEMTAARETRAAERAERRAQKAGQRQAKMFERLDTDGSGGLSQAEMEAGKAKRAEARGERRGRDGAKGRRGGAMRMLRRADANKDQMVTREEFDAAIEARFARIDTDASGTISAAEREAAKSERRGGPRGKRGPRRERSMGAGS